MSVEERIAAAFVSAGVQGALHATDLGTGREVTHRPDEPSVMASVFKLPILVTLVRAADAGRIDLSEQVTVPVEGRAYGPTGISVMTDPVTLSWRDLARWMIVVSDNAATDVLLARLGIDAVNATMRELGCHRTQVVVDCRGLFKTVVEDADLASLDDVMAQSSHDRIDAWRALRPLETNGTTPRDMTRLLGLIWKDQAASPESCALVREILTQQVWPHRLASGFPEDGVVTGGKTGTLPRIRNEVGVVQYGDGGRYTLAVFTTAVTSAAKNPAADAVIGQVARLAVDALREPAV